MDAPDLDRISQLRDNLLEEILVRLPLHEVVATSVLSKRWKYLWTQLPKLIFDSSFCTESVRNDKVRLKLIIEHILFHSRKPILEFTFSLDGLSSSGIDKMVNYVCDNGVNNFKLAIPNGELYELCSFDQLCSVKHLILESCRVKVPCEFRSFTMLRSMELFNVEVDGYELSSLISSCPLFQTLTLKNLQICCSLYLDAPNLKFFRSSGFFLSLWLHRTPLLEKMSVKVKDWEYDVEEYAEGEVDMIVPFSIIPALKALTLDGSFLKYMNVDGKIKKCQAVLNNLIFIKLTDVSFESVEVSRNVLSLIQRSPNLEKLVVMSCTERSASDLGVDPGVGVWQDENLSEISLNRLQRVYVFNVTSKPSELLFIGTILTKSPVLKTMVINLHNSINEEDGFRISEEICKFGHASSRIEVICKCPEMNVIFQINFRKLYI